MALFGDRDKKNILPVLDDDPPADDPNNPPDDPKKEDGVITVESLVTIEHDQETHKKGDRWDIMESHAEQLLKIGAVKKI